MELYRQVRHAVRIEGLSRREAARRFGLDPRTVAKMLAFSVPPGYRRSRPPARPKGMWRRTYERLVAQVTEDDAALNQALLARYRWLLAIVDGREDPRSFWR